MSIDGFITVTTGQSLVPATSWFLTGEDGNHYFVTGGTDPATLGCLNTDTLMSPITNAQWLANCATVFPTLTADAAAAGPIPIAGTSCFYITGKAHDATGFWAVGIRYQIVDQSTVSVNGGFAYRYTTSILTLAGGLGTCWCFGTNVINGELLACVYLYNGVPIFDSLPSTYLIRLPIDIGGTILESDMSVWPTKRTYLGTVFPDSVSGPEYWLATTSYNNKCSLMAYP